MTYEIFLFALTLWREARGETKETQYAVAWSIRNRRDHPTWYGKDLIGVLTHPLQYSSMTYKGDPNTVKYPTSSDASWVGCLAIVNQVLTDELTKDPTNQAVSYFDKSLDKNPPTWSVHAIHCCDVGDFHFYKFS